MRWVIMLVLSMLVMPMSVLADAAGSVEYLYGDVSVIREGKVVDLKTGASVFSSDEVVTGSRGRVKLSMIDGSRVFLGRNSRLDLEKYETRRGSLFSGTFNMLWGKARFIVAKLRGQGSSFKVKTTTAVLGVRGTNFVVSVQQPSGIDPFQIRPLQLPRLPTTTLLQEGSLLVRAVPGGQKVLLQPGQLANILPSGRIDVRPFGQKDLDVMGADVSGRIGRPGEKGPEGATVPVVVQPPSVIYGNKTVTTTTGGGGVPGRNQIPPTTTTTTIQVPVGVKPPVIVQQPVK